MEQQIADAYQTYLGRAASPSEIAWHLPEGQNAISIIANSPEAKSRASAPAAAPAATPTQPDPDAAYRQALQDQVGGLFNEAESSRKTMANPVDTYNNALQTLGITDARTRLTDARTQLFNTENLLKALPADVQGRTQDYNVSQAQRDRLTAAESAPLAGQVDVYNQALSGAQQDYSMITGEAKTQADMKFQGDQAQRSALIQDLQTAIGRSNDAEQKRQWTVELNRQLAADAEAKREYDQNYSLEQQKEADSVAASVRSASSSSSSGNYTQSKDASLASARQQVMNTITSGQYLGSDGKLGPYTYNQMKNEWIAAGYSAKDFDDNFKQFAVGSKSPLSAYGLS